MDYASWPALVAALDDLAESRRDDLERGVRAKQAISALLLCADRVSVGAAARIWSSALPALCGIFAQTGLPDAAILAENLAALLLWRVEMGVAGFVDELEELLGLVEEMNSAASLRALERAGLRTASRFGPANARRLVTGWIGAFRAAHARCLGPAEEPAGAGDVAELPGDVLSDEFALLYDMPFVQQGLATLALECTWRLPVRVLWDKTRDPAAPALTRALAAIALIDELPPHAAAGFRATHTAALFAELSAAVPPEAFVALQDVNASPQTAHDVRVSAAFAFNDPYARAVPLGSVAARLRADADFLLDATFVARDALAFHASAVAKLLRAPRLAAPEALAALAEFAGRVWDEVQASRTAAAAVRALVSAGFTSRHCVLFERAVVGRGPERGDGGDAPPFFAEARQAVGCVAVLGGVLFKLLARHGRGLDYVTFYTATMAEFNVQYAETLASLGIPEGGAEQTIRHCMAPQPVLRFVADARAGLEEEAAAAEAALGVGAPSAARESLLAWFDLRSQERWGIPPPPPPPAPASVPRVAAPARAPGGEELRRAVLAVRYPSTRAPDLLAHQAFVPYFVAAVVGDVVAVVGGARFSARSAAGLVPVLTWARDYGADAVPNVDGYRTKLSALLFNLLPFCGPAAAPPTVAQAGNVEALLGELRAVAAAALGACRDQTLLRVPDRPTLQNSAFLSTMLVNALYHALRANATHTAELADSIEAAAASMGEAVADLGRLFRCSFTVDAERWTLAVYASPDDARPVGAWKIVHVIDGVNRLYAEVDSWRADLRADVGALKGALAQTVQSLQTCEGAAAQGAGGPCERALEALSESHRRLVRAQTGLEVAAGKLISGAEPPGLRYVAAFLHRWDAVDAALYRATAPGTTEEHVAALIEKLRRVWDEVHADREVAPPPPDVPRDEARAAARRILRDRGDGVGGAPEASAVLGPRANVESWTEVDLSVLGAHTTLPPGDSTPAGDLITTHEWITPEELLAAADGTLTPTA
ncbi:tegument protein UL37 [Beluga whale alphaherpesvirus 1]|uniref:Tegument protein UL37 n=1 Tax=Beluga whale alphaherpesvirus 1 TaxID=1434720 RepID=A0A286MM43_9ALPH|nr:tegument protein UL37 [Beluga whale alphaherpesvirus 1]ASW27069.1 tegument protein UL37 [Beluga whale alphaherpesvirus 1]